jgi:hypothetical protein
MENRSAARGTRAEQSDPESKKSGALKAPPRVTMKLHWTLEFLEPSLLFRSAANGSSLSGFPR